MPVVSPPGPGPLGVSSIVMRPRHRSARRPSQRMDFVLDLLQGVGIAAAVGIRPFLPVLLAGALASGDLGLDFDGTDFAFLESWPFLLAAVLGVGRRSVYARARPGGRAPAARRTRSPAVAWSLGRARGRRLARRPRALDRRRASSLGAAAASLGFLAARDAVRPRAPPARRRGRGRAARLRRGRWRWPAPGSRSSSRRSRSS